MIQFRHLMLSHLCVFCVALGLIASGLHGEGVAESKCSVILSTTQGGSVSGGGKYANGELVTLQAKPLDGYLFCGWSDGFTDTVYTFTMGAEDKSLTAFFASEEAVKAYIVNHALKTKEEVDAMFEAYVAKNELMTHTDALILALELREVFTIEMMKSMAFGNPTMTILDENVEVAISLQTAETLDAWKTLALQGAALEIDDVKGQVRIKVPKGSKDAAFYKFVVPNEQ